LTAQWFRYPNAQVFAFDKGYSLCVLTRAANGDHPAVAALVDTVIHHLGSAPRNVVSRDRLRQ